MIIRDKKEVILKATQLIHTDHCLSIGAQQLFGILVRLATPQDDNNKGIYKVYISTLRKYLESDSNNYEHIKKSLSELHTTKMSFNIFDKVSDKVSESTGSSVLLADLYYDKKDPNLVTYSFSPIMNHCLFNLLIYARIDLKVQRKFTSKFSIGLWELCLEHLHSSKIKKGVMTYSVDELRCYFGTTNSTRTFSYLNYVILKPAIEEINRVSGMNVSIEYIKEGNKVVFIEFHIIDNSCADDAIMHIRNIKNINQFPFALSGAIPLFTEDMCAFVQPLIEEIEKFKISHPLKYKFAFQLILTIDEKKIFRSSVQSYLRSRMFLNLSEEGLLIYNITSIIDPIYPFALKKECEYIIDEIKFEEAA